MPKDFLPLSLLKIEMSVSVPKDKRYINLLDGTSWLVGEDDCQGCILNNKVDLPEYLLPIYESNRIFVRQDTEFAVPGFYIISSKEHIGSIGDMDPEIASQLAIVTHLVRRAMKLVLNVNVASVYHEERLINSHFHQWMLPYWAEAVEISGFMPKIYSSNIKKYQKYEANVSKYLKYFQFDTERVRILEVNKAMRDFLNTDGYTTKIIKLYKLK